MESNELLRLLEAAQDVPVSQVDLSASTKRIKVDMDTRKITGHTEFGVIKDHLAETVVFEVKRYKGDTDLAEKNCAIHWENGENGGVLPVTEIDLSEDGHILMRWELHDEFTQHEGKIVYALHFFSILDGGFTYHAATNAAAGMLGGTLNASAHSRNKITPSEIEVYIAKMNALSAEIDQKIDSLEMTDEQAQKAVNNYLSKNPVKDGADGKSAYEFAKDGGYKGTEAEFAEKLAMEVPSKEEFSRLSSEIADLSVFVTPQMYGAKGDGETDDTAAIQAALDASSYVYFPDGTYMINGTNDGWGHTREGGIYPRSNQTILLSNNAILKAISNETGFYNIVNINSVDNIYISGGKVQGNTTNPTRVDPAPGGEFGYGVSVYGASNVTIENMEVFDCWGDSVFIGYNGSNGVNANNVKVINCVLRDSRRQGISIVGCINAMIRDCEIYNISGTAPQYGIDIEPDGTVGVAKNITIDGCYIHDCAVGGIVVAKVDNEIQGVNITNCITQSVNIVGGNEVSVSDCNIEETINLRASLPVRISNSTIRRIYLSGGSGIFDNCDIVEGNDTYLIVSSTDGYPAGKSNLTCYNCRLSTSDVTQYFLFTNAGDATNGHPADMLTFVNCSIEMGLNCVFANLFNLNEMRIDSCKIVYKRDLYEMFTFGSKTTSLILRNTEFECSGTPSYMFNTCSGSVSIEMSNCKVPTIKNLLYSDDGATGKIRLFNNEINKTNFYGSGVFDKFISNSIDTVPTAGSNNLITSGAVQEALENYKPNVNTSGVEYEAVDSVEQMTDTSKIYMLNSTGTFWVYGDKSVIPNFTNLAKTFAQDKRLNSSGALVDATGATTVEDYIQFQSGDVVRVKGFGALSDYVCAQYNSGGTCGNTFKGVSVVNYVTYAYDSASGIVTLTCTSSTLKQLRISGVLTGTIEDVIITLNEEITYKQGFGWYNTEMTQDSIVSGGSYIELLVKLNDYASRLSVLEQKTANL